MLMESFGKSVIQSVADILPLVLVLSETRPGDTAAAWAGHGLGTGWARPGRA